MTFPASSSAASHLLFRADRVLVFAAVLAAVVSTAGAGGGLCPATCRCLERSTVVVCSDLVHVPPIPSNVVVLNLDHNRISLLQNSSLRGAETAASDGAGDGARTILRRLEVLSIEDNGLLYIEVGALSTLYELRVLRLGRNHLSTLPRELLAANRKLQVLDLHANYLASMPDGVVRHAHGLVMLNVSFNHLTSARLGDGFRHIGQLSVIDMSGKLAFHMYYVCGCSSSTCLHVNPADCSCSCLSFATHTAWKCDTCDDTFRGRDIDCVRRYLCGPNSPAQTNCALCCTTSPT
jgi:hypothetical protein